MKRIFNAQKLINSLYRKRILILAAFLISTCNLTVNAQQSNDFQKKLGLQGVPVKNFTMTPTKDGGYFMAACHEANIDDKEDALVFYKLNTDLQKEWMTTFKMINHLQHGGLIEAKDVKQTSDRGFIVSGRIIDEGNYIGAFILKLNAKGHYKWIKTYVDKGMQSFNAIEETMDGYILIGERNGNLPFTTIGVIIHVNHNGEIIWAKDVWDDKWINQRPLGSEGFVQLNDIVPISNNRYALVGTVNALLLGGTLFDGDMMVIIVNEGGTILNQWVYGKSYTPDRKVISEFGKSITYNSDENVLFIVGETLKRVPGTCTYPDYFDLFVTKIDPDNGRIYWANRYDIGNNQQLAHSYIKATDIEISEDEVAISGTLFNDVLHSSGSKDGFLLNLDKNGGTVDFRLYGDGSDDYLFKLDYNNKQRLVAAGYSKSRNQQSVWLVERFSNIMDKCRQDTYPVNQEPIHLPIQGALVASLRLRSTNENMQFQEEKYIEEIFCSLKDAKMNRIRNTQMENLLINQLSNDKAYLIYPNPTRNQFSIAVAEPIKNVSIRLFTMTGQLLKDFHFDEINYKTDISIPSDWGNGTYLIEMQSNGQQLYKDRLVIIK